jgi:hypothetical protein
MVKKAWVYLRDHNIWSKIIAAIIAAIILGLFHFLWPSHDKGGGGVAVENKGLTNSQVQTIIGSSNMQIQANAPGQISVGNSNTQFMNNGPR